MRARAALAAALVAPALLAAGCGGDHDSKSSSSPGTSSTATAPSPRTASTPTETTMAPNGTPTERTTPAPPQSNGGAKGPESAPGGAGDEVPNSTQALVTGRAGKVSPSTVSVPPFIAITLELRSADGKPYSLSGGGKTVKATATKPGTASFAGLHAGRKITLTGSAGTVTITANADPGP